MRWSEITEAAKASPTIKKWLHSQCWDFAIALHDFYGWKLGWYRTEDSFWLHAFAITPDGRYVDASGYVTPEEIHNRYGKKRGKPIFDEATDQQIGRFGSVSDESIEAALRLIPTLPYPPFNTLPGERSSTQPKP